MGSAVAVVLIKERHVAEAFERAGATTPDRAVAPDDVRVATQGSGWRRLRERDIVRSAAEGRFYLDVTRWQADRRRRQIRVLILAGVVLVLAIEGWIMSSSPR
jgi:hypothetical protein